MKVPKDFPALVQVDVPGLEDLFSLPVFKPIVKFHPEQGQLSTAVAKDLKTSSRTLTKQVTEDGDDDDDDNDDDDDYDDGGVEP